ncbi:MAG: methyltransferase domain-containing protein [Gemmatimonadota bacterium]|nr:methyltransferase domain-containing protein [Gemmatimonadota bacterium]
MIVPPEPQTTDRVARHYDEVDGIYRELWGEHLHHGLWLTGEESPETAVETLVRRVADAAKIGERARVCDIGCGYGATARWLAERRSAEVTGVTLSRNQVEVARSRPVDGPAPRFLLGDWLKSGLPGSSFDAAIAIESSEHMEDKAAFAREAHRILRPGGRLVVCAWTAAEEPRAWEVSRLLEPICVEGRLPGLATAEEYRGWLGGAGFEGIAAEDLSECVRRTWSVCVRRMVGWLASRPAAWRYVLDPGNEDRAFGRGVLRIWLAYRTGCLRYTLIRSVKG